MSAQGAGGAQIKEVFQSVSGQPKAERPGRKAKRFSIRLSDDELVYLRSKAGRRPLSAWCREQLLGSRAENRIELKQPQLEDQQYASLLAALGESRLSSNINQLAKHANMGTLDIGSDTEQELQYAVQAIIDMRKALFIALGLKP